MDKERLIRIGRIIRRARKAKGWTQRELGAKIGKSFGTISDIERGRGYFNFRTIEAISSVLDIPLHELIGEQPYESNEDNYLKKSELADLINLVETVKEQPELYLDGKKISKETRVFVEDFLDMIVERELKKHKKKTPKKEPK